MLLSLHNLLWLFWGWSSALYIIDPIPQSIWCLFHSFSLCSLHRPPVAKTDPSGAEWPFAGGAGDAEKVKHTHFHLFKVNKFLQSSPGRCLFEHNRNGLTDCAEYSLRDALSFNVFEKQRLKFKIFFNKKWMASTTWKHICALHMCDGAGMNQMNRRTAAWSTGTAVLVC